jgi:hypothetical protein
LAERVGFELSGDNLNTVSSVDVDNAPGWSAKARQSTANRSCKCDAIHGIQKAESVGALGFVLPRQL